MQRDRDKMKEMQIFFVMSLPAGRVVEACPCMKTYAK